VDAAHYRTIPAAGDQLPAEAASWARPVLGYTGTIHPDRIDVDLLASVAQRWRGAVVMIGPNHLKPPDLAKLQLPNLFFSGAVSYARLPALMRGFDVCIVPHRVTPFTESLNPIKLWEYLAAGKPIVSTDVAGFRDFPQFVRIARDADEFARAATDALGESSAMVALRQGEAAGHSWQARLDQVERVIEQCLAAKPAEAHP
jgi:teichuronic acid biosynthesis glycosyltransferase TuaH